MFRCCSPSARTPTARSPGSATRPSETIRAALAKAAAAHLPDWPDDITPHVLRHFCASQLYLAGMDLLAIQEVLGHAWIATTMRYVHLPSTHVEDAWLAGQARAATRLEGLRR
ncbi:tyrosine-type recombinase/integrase [Nonomuraea sp. NPDC049480]|uniref:tyrosine-type recombinase/integrase n=1 Tax=Nonomuraea sp. NPDC049480 TaxID=3364353 RepID=UPI0037A41A7D